MLVSHIFFPLSSLKKRTAFKQASGLRRESKMQKGDQYGFLCDDPEKITLFLFVIFLFLHVATGTNEAH